MKILFLFIIFLNSKSYGAGSYGRSSYSTESESSDLSLHMGFGFAELEVKSPISAANLADGTFLFIGGEKRITDFGSSITVSLNYLTSDGLASYDYSNGGTSYIGSDIGFDFTNYQIGVGLKQNFLADNWLSPYLHAGGILSYNAIKYNSGAIVSIGPGDPNAYEAKESVIGFGYFGEIGLEINFSETFGALVGGRYQYAQTKDYETIGNQKLTFHVFGFQAGLLLRL